jgi:hypothetical protein
MTGDDHWPGLRRPSPASTIASERDRGAAFAPQLYRAIDHPLGAVIARRDPEGALAYLPNPAVRRRALGRNRLR